MPSHEATFASLGTSPRRLRFGHVRVDREHEACAFRPDPLVVEASEVHSVLARLEWHGDEAPAEHGLEQTEDASEERLERRAEVAVAEFRERRRVVGGREAAELPAERHELEIERVRRHGAGLRVVREHRKVRVNRVQEEEAGDVARLVLHRRRIALATLLAEGLRARGAERHDPAQSIDDEGGRARTEERRNEGRMERDPPVGGAYELADREAVEVVARFVAEEHDEVRLRVDDVHFRGPRGAIHLGRAPAAESCAHDRIRTLRRLHVRRPRAFLGESEQHRKRRARDREVRSDRTTARRALRATLESDERPVREHAFERRDSDLLPFERSCVEGRCDHAPGEGRQCAETRIEEALVIEVRLLEVLGRDEHPLAPHDTLWTSRRHRFPPGMNTCLSAHRPTEATSTQDEPRRRSAARRRPPLLRASRPRRSVSRRFGT